MKTRIHFLFFAFILAASACNLPTEKPAPTPSQTSLPKESTAEATPGITLTETDACKLLDEASASRILGESVAPPTPVNAPGYSSCMFFTNTGKGIHITITLGDQAKRNFLNEIAQYQKGCSISYSGGTNTATPFPPEVEALMSKSVLELLQMDNQMQVKCGGKVEAVPEFGPGAYAYLTPNAVQIGALTIVSGDHFYSFGYADPGLDIAQMVEKAKEVTRAVMSPAPMGASTPTGGSTPVGNPTPVSSPTGVGPTPIGGPTPVGGPTWVGPTPIGGPTPVGGPTWVGPTPIGGPTPVGGPTPTWIK